MQITRTSFAHKMHSSHATPSLPPAHLPTFLLLLLLLLLSGAFAKSKYPAQQFPSGSSLHCRHNNNNNNKDSTFSLSLSFLASFLVCIICII